MRIVLALLEDDGALEVRHPGVDAGGGRAAGDGDAAARMRADQMVKDSASDDRIADTVGGDE
jgi:hypothetical protein